MKNFWCFLCLLLCVLHCVLSNQSTTEDHMEMLARSVGITTQDLQECLNKANSDLDTMMELSETVWENTGAPISSEIIKKVGCFGACIHKKNGVLVDSKILPEKFMELVGGATRRRLPNQNALRVRVHNCSNRVLAKTDECDIVFSFSRCIIEEMRKCESPECQ